VTAIQVLIDTPGVPVRVGTARVTRSRGIDTTEFSYDAAFLAGPGWEVSPDLPVRTGSSVVAGLPGALDDSAPDSWGRNLITRRLAAQAREAGHVTPTPTEVDYLLGVNDLTRQGALRYRRDDREPFLAASDGVPHMARLGTLYDATRAVAGGTDADAAVATLLDAGSGSLGGARPKASVADGNTLYVAKFPRGEDPWDVIRWEAVALDLAESCGLRTPPHHLHDVGGVPVLLVERFDRDGDHRIPFLSARSLIGAGDEVARDYLELVDALTEHGSDVRADLDELWQRAAFSIALNNVDDHMRNHAALRVAGGWTLSPVFDVNPDARATAPSASSIAGETAPTDRRTALMATADRFGLSEAEAKERWHQIVEVVSTWRAVASTHGIPTSEQDQFAGALDRWAKESR
jgi:serine/threonine-protein kinase HipA